VRLDDKRVVLALAARGVVHVPVERLVEAEEAEVLPTPPQHPPWQNSDENYQTGLPLLAEIDAVRPEHRPPHLSGRVYSIADHTWTSDGGRSDSFVRLGTSLIYENPLGRGGEMNFDGEANHRSVSLPERGGTSTSRMRIDRLSYAWGGTRFDHERHEVGRFLQRGVIEFGELDGYEWSTRRKNGDRFGTSVGFIPEATAERNTGEDLQLATYYEWVADEREELTATGGYQRSYHNGAPDRDLVVTKLRYWPEDAWSFHGTTWIDIYSSGDTTKGSGIELTRALLGTSRRWDDGDGLNFAFTHEAFAEVDRYDLMPLVAEELAQNSRDRVSSDGWTWLGEDRRWHGHLGLWMDHDRSGADAESGIEEHGLFLDDGVGDLTLFGALGKFSTTFGARCSYGRKVARTRWDLSYEISMNDQVGFSEDNDDIIHHRLRGSVDIPTTSNWSFSIHGEAITWANQAGLSLGFYLQRSF